MSGHEPITPDDLRALKDETFLRGVTHFEETDSTNSQAIGLLAAAGSLDTPHLVYAESQVAGRGRGSNRWWSDRGSLTFSVIANFEKLGLSPSQKPMLPLLTGMAILQTAKPMFPSRQVAIKWPNDVYLQGRKLAGVLIEVPAQPQGYAVIGVGMNINSQFSGAPRELQGTGISLSDLGTAPERFEMLDRMEVLATFLREWETLVDCFVAGSDVFKAWPDHCFLTGKTVTLQVGPGEIIGVCRGIDSDGALMLETEQGRQRFLGGTVCGWT